jgi:HlyD family secretion protein
MISLRIAVRYRKLLVWIVGAAAIAVVFRLTVLGPLAIQTTTMSKRNLTAQVYGNGTVETKVVMSVSSKVTGRIETLFADQGDTVTSEQLLAKLENEDYRQQVLEAQAKVNKAGASLGAADADKQKAQASVELAEKNYARVRAMSDKGLVSQQNVDEQFAVLSVAQREVERATASVEVAQKDRLASLASLAFAESRMNDMVVTTPVDGIIISRDLEKGSTVVPGLPMFRIADPSIIWVTAYIDESQSRNLAVGQPAEISLRSAPEKKFNGHVARIGIESDRVTEEIEVDVAFDAPLPGFRIGERAEVYITTETKQDSPVLPAGAIVSMGKQKNVWVIENGKLRHKAIVTGIEDRAGLIEVESGLDDGTPVAVGPPSVMMSFKDGMRVKALR